VEITNLEEKKIRDDASRACGGADQECVARTEAKLRQEKLTEKQSNLDTAEAEIKGRRLTVIYVDEWKESAEGRSRRTEVQTLPTSPAGILRKDSPLRKRGSGQVQEARSHGTRTPCIYVFSVAATYVVFSQKTQFGLGIAVPATVTAIFVPFSGYFMILFYFGFFSAVDTYVGKVQ
jgi:hypothetical protein